MTLREISLEEATRTEHLPECAGYDECCCFSDRFAFADIYHLQKYVEAQRAELMKLRSLIGSLTEAMRGHASQLDMAATWVDEMGCIR